MVCPLPVTAFSEPGERTVDQQRFDRLVNLSPSAKLVFRVLQHNHPLTSQEIADRTLLPQRTARYALNKLDDADLIEERVDPQEPRTQLYSPRPVAE
jgi:DNA-binding MarR family transcriptional regulator